ncbi:endonuclease/exonuclease/phosphatase family protein [Thermophagus sp. OGC60D27]|uniref:endonuclease/exonuclease/phosphatase family protein n=1 Tax=Thermophagus sp. OGC60D27 TaxID=3458415 RepID=UPI0040379ECA
MKSFNILFWIACVAMMTLPIGCRSIYSPKMVAFYNVENLFDTIDSPGVNDSEFTPESKKVWNTGRYQRKLENISSVIAELGRAEQVEAPAVMGLAEVENRMVVEDLVSSIPLERFKYKIIHKDSPDARGIDVALIYRPGYFKPKHTRFVPLHIQNEEGEPIPTRDILVASGKFAGKKMHFIVCHWPSRYGGRERSIPMRNAAGDLTRSIVDSLRTEDPSSYIVVMGDLNDDPVDPAVRNHLKAGFSPQPEHSDSLYNATASIFLKGKGTLCYRGKWNLFDQFVLSPNFLTSKKGQQLLLKTGVFNQPFLWQQDGDYRGYPFRTFVGNWYHGGYSDHFPSYIIIQ